MSKKHAPDALVDGMFMGASILRVITEEVLKLGGHLGMIHYLSTPQGKENVAKIAEVIVKSAWRVPRSLMEELAFRKSQESELSEYHHSDRYHGWCLAARAFDLPMISYHGNPSSKAECLCSSELAPGELLAQLEGKRLGRHPLVVVLNHEEYVVMGSPFSLGETFRTAEINDSDCHIDLTPLKYFDMSR